MRDVVIVGGGPVGTMLACLLATAGLDVEVLEQRTEPSLRSRAIGIHPPSLRALDRINVAEDLLARAVRICEGEVRCDRRVLGRLSFADAAAEYPFVAALPQYETEGLLRARFEQLRPGQFTGGVRVLGVHDAGDGVELATESATGAGTVWARFVVAADGARSRVREAAGIGWTRFGTGATYLMGDFGDARDEDLTQIGAAAASTAVLYFERGGVVESFPLPDARRRWVAMTDRLSPHATSADLADIIARRTGVIVHSAAGPASAFAVQQHLAARMTRGRVALVGDAAHEISPIGGQGMNLGWLDAVALAPALQRAVRDPDAAASVLADYGRLRRRTARIAARQAGFNMSMGRPATGVRLQVRNGLVRSLALPPASTIVARAFTMRWL